MWQVAKQVRLVCWIMFSAAPLAAQTDFYNTEAGRPVRIEDAFAAERFAFELQLAPGRVEWTRGGVWAWSVEPEIGYGILPRSEIGLGIAIAGSEGRAAGIAGLELSALHNLNAETQTLPAFAARVTVLLPVGSRAYDDAYGVLGAIVTRSYRIARFHLNASYIFGPPQDAAANGAEVPRWLAGIAIDRTWPLQSLLLTGAVYANQSVRELAPVAWHSEAGIRQQLSPRLAMDLGVGYRFNDGPAWSLTFGMAYDFAILSLLP